MPEHYPDDAALLALTHDAHSGVEYIPTGLSPYYLEFRRLVQRTLLTAARAGDLRVYQDGALSVGMRPGRCFIGGAARAHGGASGVAIAPDGLTRLWLDAGGAIQADGELPAQRSAFVPLAEVVADGSAIVSITDLRGEAFLMAPSLAALGLAVGVQLALPGPLGASVADRLIGAAPIAGRIVEVVLSLGANLVSSESGDGLIAAVKRGGAAVCSVDPAIPSAAGAGFRSTAQGDGTAAVIHSDGSAQVQVGDVLTCDLTRAAAGTVTAEAEDAAVLVLIRPDEAS